MQNKKRYNAFVRSNLVNLCLFFVTLDTLFVQTFAADKKYVLENSFMKRVIEVKGDKLSTKSIVNKLAKTTAKPTSCDEFRLRISEGTEKIGTDEHSFPMILRLPPAVNMAKMPDVWKSRYTTSNTILRSRFVTR